VEVMVILRPDRGVAPRETLELGSLPVHVRRHDKIEALLQRNAGESADVEAVLRFAARRRLRVLSVNPSERAIVLGGSARAMSSAFGVDVLWRQSGDLQYRTHREALAVPKELAGAIAGVFGLDNRPVSKRPRHRSVLPPESATPPPVNRHTRPPKDFRRLYRFPKNATGKGQCIAVLEFGGGFEPAKLRSYLAQLGVASSRVKVREISPGGNRPLNRPGTLTPDTEVYMDLEILASVAPGATLVVYFAENSNRGWIEALRAAIFDRKYRPSVLSLSWGQAEGFWDAQTLNAIEELLRMAALLGITVC
jgi:kumamolisin